MIYFEHQHRNGRFGILYRFESRGDGLPMHAHPPELEHSVECLSGSILVRGPDWRHQVESGERFIFNSSLPHEVCALSQAIAFHEFTYGQPAEYRSLPPSELTGTYEWTVSP